MERHATTLSVSPNQVPHLGPHEDEDDSVEHIVQLLRQAAPELAPERLDEIARALYARIVRKGRNSRASRPQAKGGALAA